MDWLRHPIYTRFSELCLFSVVVLALAMGFALSSLLTRAVSNWEWQNTAALVTREVKTARLEAIFTTSGRLDGRGRDQAARQSEQRYERRMFSTLAEIYVPIFADDGRVLGVAEVYKTPDRLLKTIRWSRIVIWALSLAGGSPSAARGSCSADPLI
jgi:hypothetical protein